MTYKIELETDDLMVTIPLKEYNQLKKTEQEHKDIINELDAAESSNEMLRDQLKDYKERLENTTDTMHLFLDYLNRYKKYMRIKYNDCLNHVPTDAELTKLEASKHHED